MSCYQILAIVCLPKMVFEKIKTCYCYRLCHACSVGKTKVESRLCFSRCRLSVTLYRCSQLCLYRLRYLDVIAQKYTLSFQCNDPLYAGDQLEKAVVKLTYGDNNGKYFFE